MPKAVVAVVVVGVGAAAAAAAAAVGDVGVEGTEGVITSRQRPDTVAVGEVLWTLPQVAMAATVWSSMMRTALRDGAAGVPCGENAETGIGVEAGIVRGGETVTETGTGIGTAEGTAEETAEEKETETEIGTEDTGISVRESIACYHRLTWHIMSFIIIPVIPVICDTCYQTTHVQSKNTVTYTPRLRGLPLQ